MTGSSEVDRCIKFRLAIFFCQVGCMILSGVIEVIAGVTLLGMAQRLETTFENVSRAFAMKAVGAFLGSLCGGAVKDRRLSWSEQMLGWSTLGVGAVTAVMPFCPDVPSLGVAFAVQGLAYGCSQTVIISYLINLWGASSATPLNIVGMILGVTRAVTPYLAAAFLPDQTHNVYNFTTVHHGEKMANSAVLLFQNVTDFNNNHHHQHYHKTNTNISLLTSSINKGCTDCLVGSEDKDNVVGTYLTTAALATMMALSVAIVTGLLKPPMPALRRFITSFDAEEISQRKQDTACWFRNLVYILYIVYFYVFYVTIVVLDAYLVSISVTNPSLRFSMIEATNLVLVYSISMTCSRAVAVLVLHVVSVRHVANFFLFCACVVAIFLVTVGLTSKLAWWLTICLYSFCMGPAYFCGFAYINSYVPVHGVIVGMLDAALSLSWLSLLATSSMLELYGLQSLLVLVAACSSCCLLINLVIYFTDRSSCAHLSDTDKALTQDNVLHPLFASESE